MLHNYFIDMRKILSFLSVLLIGILPLQSAERDDFDKVVDFSLSIKEISTLVKKPDFDVAKHGKIVIFDGSVATVTILDKNPESFVAELEIVGGEWQGLESVVLYRVYVYVQGPEFARRLPERPPTAPGESVISQNDHALIVGNIADVYTDEKGNRFAVVLAHYVRIIP